MTVINAVRFAKRKINRSRFLRNLIGVCEGTALRVRGAYKNTASVSICTTIKDRFEHLSKTLPRNIADNESYHNCEFVLLDYDCPDSRTSEWVQDELSEHLETGRLSYYHFPNAPAYHAAHSRTLAFRLARGDVLCNVDADNFTGKGFAAYVSAVLTPARVFIQGPCDGRGLGGRVCVRRHDWEAVGGYDERFQNWGGEDVDLANRLRMLGLRKKLIRRERYCHSISHSDELRSRHCTQKKETSRREQGRLLRENLERGKMRPNSSVFGNGRVQKSFREWIEV